MVWCAISQEIFSNIMSTIVSRNSFLLLNRLSLPSNLNCLTTLVTISYLIQFLPEIRAAVSQNSTKICVTFNYFSDLFTEVQMWY